MNLRERLEAKRRRTVVVPIKISSSAADEEILMGARVALEQAAGRDDTAAVTQLQKQVTAAAEQVRAHWAEVELAALPADEWNAAVEGYRVDDDGQIDWAQALAPLLAASCTDPGLHDTAWWADLLARPEWSEGDRDGLKRGLLEVNVIAADPYYPKG